MENKRQNQAKRFAMHKRIAFFCEFFLNGFWAILWVFSGFSVILRQTLVDYQFPILLVNTLFIIIYGLSTIIFLLPVSWYAEFYLPHKFQVSTENISNWLADQIKGTLISGLIGIPILLAIYWFLSIRPQTWWIWAATFVILISVLVARLYPILIAPLFNKFSPLQDQYAYLAHKLAALAESVKMPVSGVYQFDMSRRSKAANAALMGLASSRRIVLSDTLLDTFNDEEIETILAHELGHYAHKDISISILVNSLLIVASFYLASHGLNWGIKAFSFSSIADIATLPWLEILFGLMSLLVFPAQNSFSRFLERRADAFAIHITRNPAAYASALRKLADQNLAELDPDPWIEFFMHSHPALEKRIKFAEGFSGAMDD
jgi:STE24 endopeptidase